MGTLALSNSDHLVVIFAVALLVSTLSCKQTVVFTSFTNQSVVLCLRAPGTFEDCPP